MYPFRQNKINSNLLLREFSSDTSSEDLIWHRDVRNRTVVVIESAGWMLQMDNSLPIPLLEGSSYNISAGEWHRVIKGTGKLVIAVKEYD